MNMQKLLPFIFLLSLLFYSCKMKTTPETIEKWKTEILETEQNFAEAAIKEGISNAFLMYASEDAVLMRNNTLVIGKTAIKNHFENQSPKNTNVSLTWKPDFVDVAASGDLGYTYGKYMYSFTNSEGNTIETNGVFHTVWKRQLDGTWKFVWD